MWSCWSQCPWMVGALRVKETFLPKTDMWKQQVLQDAGDVDAVKACYPDVKWYICQHCQPSNYNVDP